MSGSAVGQLSLQERLSLDELDTHRDFRSVGEHYHVNRKLSLRMTV